MSPSRSSRRWCSRKRSTATSTRPTLHGTKQFLPFAYLLTALLFARSGLYAERAAASRADADRRVAVRGGLRGADLRGRQRRTLLELLPLLRLARIRDLLCRVVARASMSGVTGVLLRAAGYRRRAVLVGSGKHIARRCPRARRRAALGRSRSSASSRRRRCPSQRAALAGFAATTWSRSSARHGSTR